PEASHTARVAGSHLTNGFVFSNTVELIRFSYVESSTFKYSDAFGLVKHTSGRWIECGKGCRIRIDFTFDEATGSKIRHLHWECKGDTGECGGGFNSDSQHQRL
ncbi:hypothetical protein, partial [Xanthomonas oryzae]|uniref:hypothetical protein n=2 Tax=Xanthomonas oryzae TaxID=347 RepID=UPI001C670F79